MVTRRVFRDGRWVLVPYPVAVGGAAYVGGPVVAGGPAPGRCSTNRNVSLTPAGFHKVVTVTTCIRP